MAVRDPLGLIGEKLNRYRIEEFAGQGGMSVVYRAAMIRPRIFTGD
jgi:hypothetical protein